MLRIMISLVIVSVNVCWYEQHAQAKFGWADADIVLDFGVEVEPADRQIIVDQAEVGYPFHVDVVWELHPQNCVIQFQQDGDKNGTTEWQTIQDDQLFNGKPAHARVKPKVS